MLLTVTVAQTIDSNQEIEGGLIGALNWNSPHSLIITKESSFLNNFFFFNDLDNIQPHFIKAIQLQAQTKSLSIDHSITLDSTTSIMTSIPGYDPLLTYLIHTEHLSIAT